MWYLFVPAVAGALWARYRQMRRAARLGLVRPWAWRRLCWALISCGGFLLLTLSSIFYETVLWLPALAVILVVGMALFVRAARPGVHPGLRGFYRPLPVDGLGLIARERTPATWRWRLWRLAPATPLLALLLVAASSEARRWLIWTLAGSSALAPALLIPYRRAWSSPLFLLLIPIVLGWHALRLRAGLPPGQWTTPWSAARCSAQVAVIGDGTAWCVNARTNWVYHYDLLAGFVGERYLVDNSTEVFIADEMGAWIRPRTGRGLVYVGGDNMQTELDNFFFPISGALISDGELWVVDGMQQLQVHSGGEPPTQLTTFNSGLLDDWVIVVTTLPDKSVWVGAGYGISRYFPDSGRWRTYTFQRAGFQGAVTDLAAESDGSVWALQREAFDAFNQTDWWLSSLRPDGEWLHVNLAELVGLQAPPGRDVLAVDGLGRAWFMAMSYTHGEIFLGVLNPDMTLAYPMYSLGRDSTAVPYRSGGQRPARVGVLPDGDGGIYLYNGEKEPFRHWHP